MSLVFLSPTTPAHSSPQTTANLPTSRDSLVLRTQLEDLQTRAQARLRACPYREVQGTTCLFNKGVLLLQGRVSSFYLKQVAQTVLMNIEGVKQIVNMIQVSVAKQATAANPSQHRQ